MARSLKSTACSPKQHNPLPSTSIPLLGRSGAPVTSAPGNDVFFGFQRTQLVLSIHMPTHNTTAACNTNSRGCDALFWLLPAPDMQVVQRHTCRPNTHKKVRNDDTLHTGRNITRLLNNLLYY